jgi:hypothetical protein
MKRRAVTLLAALVLIVSAQAVSAAPPDPARRHDSGLRLATGDGVDTAEFYVRWPAPWLEKHLVEPYLAGRTVARWETALSYWSGKNDHAVVFALGPTFEYPLAHERWALTFGIQPTLFSDYASESRDLGGPFEFTSHVGVRWRPAPDWYLGARVQHTSNAGIYENNPGVDLFALELGTKF